MHANTKSTLPSERLAATDEGFESGFLNSFLLALTVFLIYCYKNDTHTHKSEYKYFLTFLPIRSREGSIPPLHKKSTIL